MLRFLPPISLFDSIRWKKITFFVLALGLIAFSTASPARAGVWGEPTAAGLMTSMIAEIQQAIKGALLGSLKAAAIQMLNNQIERLIGGNSVGQALFITDYKEFLYESSQQQAQIYMNTFFSDMTRGKYASANYSGVGDIGSEIEGNYLSYLMAQAEEATTNIPKNTYDLDDYVPNPEVMFETGDMRGFAAFYGNCANNPLCFTAKAEEAYQGFLTSEIESAKVKAQSSGFSPQEVGGKVVTPAGTIESLAANVQDIGNQVIATAENPGAIIGGVITSMVNRTVTKLVQRGVGKVQANIQREVNDSNRKTAEARNKAARESGPGSQFTQEIIQRTRAQVNTNTPPPNYQMDANSL